MAELVRRRYGHSEGTTHLCFDSKSQLVTCGHDSDVRIFPSIIEDDDCTEFSVPAGKLSSLVCYLTPQGTDIVAVAMENTVQAYNLDGTPEGLLLRFVGHVTYLAVSDDHTHLAAGSSEFLIKVVELKDLTKVVTFNGHEAPVLCVRFDPLGEYLASSSCDGTVRIWSLERKSCIQTLAVLPKTNDITLAKSLCYLSWQPANGKMLAVPIGSEVKLYDRETWRITYTLSDTHHREVINVVSWSPCGKYLASGGIDGALVLWTISSQSTYQQTENENKISFTALEWDLRGRGSDQGDCLVFADKEGCMGAFQHVYPSNQTFKGTKALENDPLIDDSLLMEGIPADDIFNDDYNIDDDVTHNGLHGDKLLDDNEDDDIIQSRKRRRLEIEEDDPLISNHDDEHSNQSSTGMLLPTETAVSSNHIVPRRGAEFSEKMIEKYQSPFQPSATPDHLEHRFLVYNLVGLVRSHSDDDAALIEVEFHNTSIHHTFSLANHHGYSIAALNEQALVLACEKNEDQPSILHCVHFSSWETNKDWTVSLPSKESTLSVAIGNGWIAIATNKRMIRMFTTGGVQRDLLSVPGVIVSLTGWGERLAIVYQNSGPCTENLFNLTVWVLDVCRRKQLHPPHTLPLSYRAKLEWIGFSEEGLLVSNDTKGMVRILSGGCYGGLSWIPVLDMTKQLGNKSDHYFVVGMTHNPIELRAILCKGMEYPPVHPKPVMNTLSFKMPLCDGGTEKTELEDSYLQTCLLSRGNDTTEQVQLLMKQFALSCKAGNEFRAWEIAGMMPDEHSMNLALTYASRTQHVRLARHISELIQQKSIDCFEEAYTDSIGQADDDDWTNQIADDEGSCDLIYVQSRSETLKRGPQPPPPAMRKSNSGKKYSKGNSLSRSARDSRAGSGLKQTGNVGVVNDHHDDVDETRELFSGSDSENGVEQGEELGDDPMGVEEFPMTSPLATNGCEGKRTNPFKIATPVNRKIQLDRKSTFLDNISSKVSEEQRKREIRKERGVNDGRLKGSSRKTGKMGSKKLSNQGSLKSSFFKKKGMATTSHDKSVNDRSSPTNDVTNGSHNDKDDKTTDQQVVEESAEHDSDGSKMNSKEKLSLFAFTPKES